MWLTSEASQVVPPLDSSVVQEDMYEKVTRDIPGRKPIWKFIQKEQMKDCQRF